MLKILTIVDKEGTALDRLAKGVARYHTNLDYKVLAVHPKRPDAHQLAEFEREIQDTDIIDAQYFRTIEKLREMYPEIKNIPTILTHNNPYSIEEQDWNEYDMVVGNNNYIYKRLGEITTAPVEYVPIVTDPEFWQYNTDKLPYSSRNLEADDGPVIMVANRIESKKGILEVAIACADLHIKFILVGAISDANYFASVMATRNVEYYEQISDFELRQLYYKSSLHVCNSVDNFESGTMPVLEAMQCGTPVLSRKVGHVPDLYNGENLAIYEGASNDVIALTDRIKEVYYDKKLLSDLRDKGWQTAKTRNFERRAYLYQKLYRQVLYPNQIPVSVVVPIYDKPDIILKCLNAVAEQTYKNIELIVADDSGEHQQLVKDFATFVNIPVRYINNFQSDYGLARARNVATIEATGDVMVYCDQRNIMNPDCVETFMRFNKPKVWLFGNKGANKDSFVENLSCIQRQDIIDFGLFNERCNLYGGLSQESRNRFKAQGGTTEFVREANAVAVGKSSNRNRKRQEIIKSKNMLFKLGLEG